MNGIAETYRQRWWDHLITYDEAIGCLIEYCKMTYDEAVEFMKGGIIK